MGGTARREVGEAGEKSSDGNPAFEAREGQSYAGVRAGRESEMTVGRTSDVETFRLYKYVRIPVRRTDAERDQGAFRNCHTVDLSVLSDTAVPELV